MPSRLETTLLPPNETIVRVLLGHLEHSSLLRLRRCSRVCRNAVTTHAPRTFENLYFYAPLRGGSALREISDVGPHCRHLTIKVRLPGTGRPISNVTTPMKSKRKSLLKSALENSRQSRSTSVASTDALQDPAALSMDQTLWSHAFAWCGRLRAITLRIDGDTIWPGRTIIEDMLVTLRVSLENSRMPQLRVLDLQPIHAMGIIHLRWDSFGAWKAVQPSGAQIWRNLTTLKLTLHNPLEVPTSPEKRPIIASQYLMFLKMLQAYLRSFSPTLLCFKFMWLGLPGPSPILLHRAPGMDTQLPIGWTRLEELWYGNITHQRGTLMALPQLAPAVSKIKALREPGTFTGASESEVWQDVSVPNAYTSYAPGGPNDIPVPKELLDRIEAANAAHARNRITARTASYDRPLSALLNKLAMRPVPRRKLQKIRHMSPPLSPPPTGVLPPVPREDTAAVADNALGSDEPPQRTSTSSFQPSTTAVLTDAVNFEPEQQPETLTLVPPATLAVPAPDILAQTASTASLAPSPTVNTNSVVESTTPSLEPPTAAAQRVANWRKAMALSTISFPDDFTNRDTVFSETNTDADDLYEDNGRPRPDSEAWPVTRFQPLPQHPLEARNNQQESRFSRDSMESLLTVRRRDSMDSLVTVRRRDSWRSESEYSNEDCDGDLDETGARMSIVSARVEPLRFGATRATPPPTTLDPPRDFTNTDSIYSESGAYGTAAYRPPSR